MFIICGGGSGAFLLHSACCVIPSSFVRHVTETTSAADFAACSLQQNEILRLRVLDRRDRFLGDSLSESGAKVNCVMFRACACVHHMCVLACGGVCVCEGYGCTSCRSAWSIGMVLFAACGQQRAHHIENGRIVGSRERVFVTQPSPSLTLPVSGFQGKGHIELDLSILSQTVSSFQLAPPPPSPNAAPAFFLFCNKP